MASLTHQHRASPTAPPAPGHHEVAPAEIAIGVVIGRASEYFDFFVYGIASVLVFPSVYFPFASELAGLLFSFTVFSFAFIGRPFGTALFMRIQRRWGRSTKLTASLFLLGTATVGIAFLPSYASIGHSAIYLLALFRFMQGIAFGGSWDGLPSLLALNAPENKRGWYAMVGQLGAPTGFIIAGALFLFLYTSLTFQEFIEWGWRYPFYVAFAINVVALFARLRLVVTHEYTQLLEEEELEPISTLQMVNAQGFNIFLGAFAALASYALFHLVTVFPVMGVAAQDTERTCRADRPDHRRCDCVRGYAGFRPDCRPVWSAHHLGGHGRADWHLQPGRTLAARWRCCGPGHFHPGRLRSAGAVLWPGGRRGDVQL